MVSSMFLKSPEKGEVLTCPVCFRNFKAGDDTKYICCGGYVCDWKCFLYHIKNPDRDKTVPPPYADTPNLVDKSSPIEYNKGVKTKVDLFSTSEEPPKKRSRKKKET